MKESYSQSMLLSWKVSWTPLQLGFSGRNKFLLVIFFCEVFGRQDTVSLLSSKEFDCNEAKPRGPPASRVTELVVPVIMVPATAAAFCPQLRYIVHLSSNVRILTFPHVPKIAVTSIHSLL